MTTSRGANSSPTSLCCAKVEATSFSYSEMTPKCQVCDSPKCSMIKLTKGSQMMALVFYLCLLPYSSPCGPHSPLVCLPPPSFSLHKCAFPKGVQIPFACGSHNPPKNQFSPYPNKSKCQKLLLISKLSKSAIFPKWSRKIGDIIDWLWILAKIEKRI